MPKEEERIFGPHEQETYRQYLSRLKDDQSLTRSRAAALMATSMLMQGKANQPMDREAFHALSRKLEKHPAIRLMMQDTKTVGLLRSGNGNGLLRLLADKETERQHSFDRFKRPEEFVKEDAKFLKTAADRLKQKPPLASADGKNDPEKDKRYQEMMKRLEHAQDLADHGVQLSGEKTKELIKAVKAYNDAGDKKLPGDAGEAEGHLEAMSILSRYMPEKDFRAYCKQLNKAHGAANPRQSRYEDPEAYPADRLEGGAKTAKEWYTDSKTRLMKNFSIEGCAEAAAIRRLSQGNPHKVIRRDELEGETKRLCEPGSALSRTLKDEKAREEYVHLASMGEAEDLGTDLLAAAKKHSARAAQWQVNRSIRELVSGPVNPYVAAENLANILAARELAVRGDAGESLTNGAFQARAELLRADPSFQRLASRYSEDPSFRRRMNRELGEDNSATMLQEAYHRAAAPGRERRAEQQEPQLERKPEEEVRLEPAMLN